ncbi:hypothetical protein CS536_02630 [Yersinia kristensenii]|nr:hypothetical protein CS536_02630 [Yersinia kristensenii]PJE83976.1 hypothetical protein CU276_10810 [Yersinia kristensenii]
MDASSARNTHVLRVRSVFSALVASKLSAPITPIDGAIHQQKIACFYTCPRVATITALMVCRRFSA